VSNLFSAATEELKLLPTVCPTADSHIIRAARIVRRPSGTFHSAAPQIWLLILLQLFCCCEFARCCFASF
jgi:hypothetical protein